MLEMITLGYLPSPSWNGFDLGFVKIHAYALVIILGIILALWLGINRWKDRGGQSDAIIDIAFWAIPFGIIGGRVYHVLTSPDIYFGPGFDGTGDPMKVIEIWNGGLGIMGAVAFGALGAYIAARRYGYRFTAILDVLAPGVLLAQALGRWGNWFNQELFGQPTDLPWGLKIHAAHMPAGYPADTLFHPTFLYESMWNVIGVLILLLIDRGFNLRGGMMFWSYVAYYSLGRVLVESLRIDHTELITILGLEMRLHAWFALAGFIAAVGILIYLNIRKRKQPFEESIWREGYPKKELQDA